MIKTFVVNDRYKIVMDDEQFYPFRIGLAMVTGINSNEIFHSPFGYVMMLSEDMIANAYTMNDEEHKLFCEEVSRRAKTVLLRR